MSKISNVITMLQLLSTGKKYSIKELSESLEVTERMVRVYKNELEKAGIYIDTIMGPYGGYVLRQSINLPIIKLQESDYQVLDFYIQKEKDKKKKERLLELQDKMKGIAFINKSMVNLTGDTLSKYNCLTRAIKEKRKVKILYTSYQNGTNERVICPASMFLFQDGWYCVAFCELRGDMRQFDLKRIIEYKLLDETFI